MKKKMWVFNLMALGLLQLIIALPSVAGDYNASDISLSPGADASKLNFNWQTTSTSTECAIQIGLSNKFPNNTNIFTGTPKDNKYTNEKYCEVTVTGGLAYSKNYTYRLGNNAGNWSDPYDYATGNRNNFGFFYNTDQHIGVTGDIEADTARWATSVNVMTDMFPQAAFILSGGDQVDATGNEDQWTGFFAPEGLSSLPIAPTFGSHDRAEGGMGGPSSNNMDYHFNLPNEDRVPYGSGGSFYAAGGDYYFTYGNALFIVLNMDKTKSKSTTGIPQPPQPPDTDGDGVDDGHDWCPDTPAGSAVNDKGCREGETGTQPPPPGGGGGGGASCPIDPTVTGTADVSDHIDFIQDAIEANPDVKWKIVCWHYSIYSAGNHAADDDIKVLREAIVPVMDDFDIDLVFMGHDHVYTRSYQMLDDMPLPLQKNTDTAAVNDPSGTLYITGSTASGNKFYDLNACYLEDDPYFEYVAVTDDMDRTDDMGTDDETDDVEYSMPSFSYIDVRKNMLRITTYGYTITDEETGEYDIEIVDTYKIVK